MNSRKSEAETPGMPPLISISDIPMTIKQARLQRNLSQDYVASELEITQSAYCKYERPGTQITIERLQKIAIILKVSPIELLYGKEFVDKLIQGALQQKPDNVWHAIYQIEKRVQEMQQQMSELLSIVRT